MEAGNEKIAFFYDDDAYAEKPQASRGGKTGGAAGLMGRHVAGKEFLDAYLSHGRSDDLVALVRNEASVRSIAALCRSHPSGRVRKRRLEIVGEQEFHRRFFPEPPASLLHLPQPLDPSYAWARQHGGPDAFALSGVTHTLCTERAVHLLCHLVTAPYEPYDALVCTSRATVQVVRAVTDAYADYLRDRHGGTPGLRNRLETIPLGVDTERFRPATPEERAAQRRSLRVADDEVMILFVGRLTFTGKAHPFPMFHGVAQAAQATGTKVHLILSGWARNDQILEAFIRGAQEFAPNVRVSMIDGTRPETRFAIWHAADIFTSLADSVQETFGLVIVEAMASGLPVVASDWDGYRDSVVHGETGFLVPTVMVRDATRDATSRLLVGESSYDEFAAECVQTMAVDAATTAAAYTRLVGDAGLRRRMGAAGRQRAVEHFAWPHIIKAYDALWRDQQAERAAQAARATEPRRAFREPACYPPPEETFAGYATVLLGEDDLLEAVGEAERRLDPLLATPLTNFLASKGYRTTEASVLRAVIMAATTPCALADLDSVFGRAGVAHEVGRATLGWMLKYNLLRPARRTIHLQARSPDDPAARERPV